MTRWKASGIHFSLSLLIGLTAFCLLYFVYYPQPYFEPAGASKLVMLLLSVDVILGPLLTLVVFKSGKRGMRFDLAVIAGLQACALIYGLSIMWRARPIFVIAVVDRLELVYAGDIEKADFKAANDPQFANEPLFGPIFVVARRAKPGKEQGELMQAVVGGKDVHQFPKFFERPSNNNFAPVLEKAKSFDDLPLLTQENVKSQVRNYLNDKYLPMQGRESAYVCVVESPTQALKQSVLGSAW